jgi:hypothetical protein
MRLNRVIQTLREAQYQPDPDAPAEGEIRNDRWVQSHDRLLLRALRRWLGWPSDARLHVGALLRGEGLSPPSGSGKQMRAEAAALLWELQNRSRPNDKPLYRGDLQAPPRLTLSSWTESEKTAKEFAHRASPRFGKVYRAEPGTLRGLCLADYIPGYHRQYGEDEWIILQGLE